LKKHPTKTRKQTGFIHSLYCWENLWIVKASLWFR